MPFVPDHDPKERPCCDLLFRRHASAPKCLRLELTEKKQVGALKMLELGRQVGGRADFRPTAAEVVILLETSERRLVSATKSQRTVG